MEPGLRARPESAEGLAESAPSRLWGDLLVTFGGEAGPLPSRDESAAWQRASQEAPWELSWQAPGSRWRGYPVTTLQAPPWRLWLVGELYGAATDTDLPLGVAEGRRPANDLNGHVLLLGWDESRRQWHAWTNRFGTLHAYYANDGSRAAIGTFSPAVAGFASRRRLDWMALASFSAFGFFSNDSTFFDDTRILPPASHSVFDERGFLVSQNRYWEWNHRPDRTRSFPDTVAEFGAVFETVLDEQTTTGRVAVPISGGLDSRSTVAALTRPGHPQGGARLWTYSYGYGERSVETRIASKIAVARNLPFLSLTVEPYLFERLAEVLSCVEGFQDLTQTRQAVVSGMLGEKADAVVAAHLGDVWLDDMGFPEGGPSGANAVVNHAIKKIEKRGGSWLLANLVACRVREKPGAILRKIVEDGVERLRAIEDPDFRVKAFKFEQWAFRWTLASIRMYQAGAFPRLPFCDTRLADFFATVPTEFVRGRRLQIEYLKRFAPDLARIKWQACDTNLFRLPHFRTWLLPARAAKKAIRLLAARPAPERNWEVQFLGDAGRRSLETHLLSPGRKLHDLIAPAQVRSLLDAFFATPLENGRGYTVSMLLTFSAWLEAYG